MLAALKFVKGSIAVKDFVVDLKHFSIVDGKVKGFNGILALCSPIPFDIDCYPQAEALVKSIGNCEETIQLAMTKAGRLSVKSGAYKASVPCLTAIDLHPEPEGEIIKFDGEMLLAGIKAVAPFIGTDASRIWSHGILIKGQSLFATNNVCLVEYWTGVNFPGEINIPRVAIKEMIRINEPPVFAQLAEGSITFHYSGERWLRTQLYDASCWPDLGRILNAGSEQKPIDDRLFKGLEVIKSFVEKDGTVVFGGGFIATHKAEGIGATYMVPDLQDEGVFNNEMLMLLKGVAETIDWSLYPKPCIFQGGRLRGAIVGMRS